MTMNITDIKAANKQAGYHFFERSTMRFFDSKVERMVYEGYGGVYFITSEQFHGSNGYSAPRKWTIRKFEANGDINTVKGFNELSREEAMSTARKLAKGVV
jgi:hypothetical protein